MFANDETLRRREFTTDDLPALVELINQEYPDEPTTMEQEQHWEDVYPQENPRLRLAVEATDGRVVAFGSSVNPFWMTAPGVFEMFVLVEAGWRRQGIASALLPELEAYSRAQGAARLWADARESQVHSIAWLARTGFSQYGLRFESALDLNAFDGAPFASASEQAAAAGYTLSTLAEQRRLRSDADRALFELYRDGIRDVPLPGGAVMTPRWDTWREAALSGPTFDADLVILAMQGTAMVAMTQIQLNENGPAITNATCVLREHRGHGLATAIKVQSLLALQRRGLTEARTHNDTANPTIVHINNKLGYHRIPGWTMWEKPL